MKQYIKPLLKILGFIALSVLMDVILSVGYFASMGIQDSEGLSGDTAVGLLISKQLILLLFFVIKYRKKQFLSRVRLKKTSPKILFWAFLIGIGCVTISSVLVALMQRFIPSQVAAYVDMMSETLGGSNLLMTLLSVVILAPLLEEMVMRGLLFHWFENTNIKPWALIVVSGLFFGLWHMTIVHGIFATVLGMVCALCFLMTNSLWVPIVIHFSNNAYSMGLGYLPEQFSGSIFFIVLFYLSILLVPMGIICIKRELKKNELISLQ